MQGRKLLYTLTVILYLILGLHLLALHFFLYWSIWWYDLALHFLGGFWIGGMALWIFFYSGKFSQSLPPNEYTFYIIPLIAVLILGVFWELFEFSLDTLIIFQQNEILDTVTDVCTDVSGAFTASLVISRIFFLSHHV